MKNLLWKILNNIKWFLYKKHFKSIWNWTHIFWKIYCSWKNIIIWKKCTLNNWVHLNWDWWLIIWNYCRISAGTQIHTWWLDLKKNYKNRPHIYNNVNIADWVWLWAWSIILPWVIIWEWTVIAAWAVVSKNIPSYEVWWWIPAKKIKSLK